MEKQSKDWWIGCSRMPVAEKRADSLCELYVSM